MSVQIVTGYTGERHITPYMDAEINRGIFQSSSMSADNDGSCILPTGGRMEASMPDINTFVIADGAFSIQGHIGITTGETLTIDTCATGSNRIDLVVARFEHNANTNIDSMSIVVLKGEETSSQYPTTPTYRTGMIEDGANADLPLYRINLSGSTVTFSRALAVYEGEVIHINDYDIDLKQANNSVTSIKYPGVSIQDKNHNIIARLEAVTYPSGEHGVQFYERNYNGDTQLPQRFLRVTTQKNGNAGWSSSPTFFRVISVTFPYTVNANSQGYVNAWSYATRNVPYGFSLVGFVGYSTNNPNVVMISCRAVNSQYSFEFRNISGSRISGTGVVYALYAQSGLVTWS